VTRVTVLVKGWLALLCSAQIRSFKVQANAEVFVFRVRHTSTMITAAQVSFTKKQGPSLSSYYRISYGIQLWRRCVMTGP
jgi:hypothetical protein